MKLWCAFSLFEVYLHKPRLANTNCLAIELQLCTASTIR